MRTTGKERHDYEMEEKLCNKGLVPKEIRTRIRAQDRNREEKEIDEIIKTVAQIVREDCITIWLNRRKKIQEKRKREKDREAQRQNNRGVTAELLP